jgi:hypothetical protein
MLDGLRHDLTRLRRDCAPGSPLDIVIVALAQTVRLFFDSVEPLDLATLRCDGCDPDWLAFESALQALRKSIGFQIKALANSIPILFGRSWPPTCRKGPTKTPNAATG